MRAKVPNKLEASRVHAGPFGSDASYGFNGAFLVQKSALTPPLKIIASDGKYDEIGPGWEHVSVSTKGRSPVWEEMAFVKSLFWDDDECVVQFHPPKSQYVNFHPFCLHLWKQRGVDFVLPPTILVGPKD